MSSKSKRLWSVCMMFAIAAIIAIVQATATGGDVAAASEPEPQSVVAVAEPSVSCEALGNGEKRCCSRSSKECSTVPTRYVCFDQRSTYMYRGIPIILDSLDCQRTWARD